jgi:hypothetical protein
MLFTNVPLSIITCDKPALVQAMAAAIPIGPAPIMATSNFSMKRKFLILSQCQALVFNFCSSKCKMALGEVTEYDDNKGGADLSYSWIKMKLLYK